MKKTISLLGSLLILVILAALAVSPAAARSHSQVYYQTPTPDAEGHIFYVVKEGESCISISLLTGVDLNTLRQQNSLNENCDLQVGQKLLLGRVEQPSATAGPAPTATQALPTPTPFYGNGRICIYLFEDLDGNGLPASGEAQVAAGAVSITNRSGSVSLTGVTTRGEEPLCFEDIPEGEYNVSVAPPEGYNPTTSMNYPLPVHPGDSSTLNFGAQLSSRAPEQVPVEKTSPILGFLGGLLVLGGAGLGIYVWRLKR